MTKSILVTGASGFVGQTVAKLLIKNDYSVIPMVRISKGLSGEVVLDFNDKEFSSKIKAMHPVDAIIHLGAKVDFKANLQDLFVPNAEAVAILANWAKSIDAYMIYLSTIMVYGKETIIIKEETELKLDTGYACSKWLAENAIETSGVKHLILRSAGVYGKNGSKHLGINKAISKAMKGEIPVQYGDGVGKRNYIYVVDLAKLILDCLKWEITGTYLVSGPEVISIAGMLGAICGVFLSGVTPILKEGEQGRDQIVSHSKILDCYRRNFRGALGHIAIWDGVWQK